MSETLRFLIYVSSLPFIFCAKWNALAINFLLRVDLGMVVLTNIYWFSSYMYVRSLAVIPFIQILYQIF